MPVYQEHSYFICEDFSDDQFVKVTAYLMKNQPICVEAEWWDNELTLRNFDSKYAAEDFEKGLKSYLKGLSKDKK